MNELLRDCYAVLLPAFAGLTLDDDVVGFLERGGVSILLGESREEYVARDMSQKRRETEATSAFQAIAQQARGIAKAGILVAVDQELGGIQRLHDLVPQLPSAEQALTLSQEELSRRSRSVASQARQLGVNLFLSPIVDVISGENPWLSGRTLAGDQSEVSRVATSFIQGIQAAGVAATAKHFPGHPITPLDPALQEAVVETDLQGLQPSLRVFRDVIAHGTKAVMIGPALIPAIDPEQPSSTSTPTIRLLREELGFAGLIISDDLDAPGIHRGRSIAATAVASLKAGADLLLLSSEAGLANIAETIASAVRNGELNQRRVTEAAGRVRALAQELDDFIPDAERSHE
ncbi:glycoside hydrolase family 3 N-terminal domain-containing protein [Pseudomonas knackmussii]|uniref:glycoside hydrolase family 3 N-terminal domain-containing protein n=1 Tax=Pseudomonas knackmussii TaxID=65741 RepID=UPI003F4A7674